MPLLKILRKRLPPEISELNKIEHRLFSFITQHWRNSTSSRTNSTANGAIPFFPKHEWARILRHKPLAGVIVSAA
ncbi:MAG: hypothetical protein KJ052_19595 [Candidatus Hydrogenedentes bacterium]|nr:hypothetical protein [Candidatus Hydrogenedentota bacterium]